MTSHCPVPMMRTLYVAVQLHLLEHGEVYEFSLPSAYARSILTTPWVELGGDKISISCAQTGYTANVTFHTKVHVYTV